MIEFGHGTPIVVIPGLPGPWRFIAPAVHALARCYRVLTLSLGAECTIDSDVDRIVAALDERKIDRAVICGISLGGLIALQFAARHPGRTSALLLVSTPAPGMTLPPRYRLYMKWPRLLGILFAIETPYQLRHDLRWSHVTRLVGPPVSFAKIARRVTFIDSSDIVVDCARIKAPTLVVTGERAFDHVVPVDSTREYLRLIPGSGHARLKDTGHLGSITRPELFRAVVQGYVDTILSGAA